MTAPTVGQLMEEGRLCSMQIKQLTLHPLNRQRLGDMKEFTEDVRRNGVQVPVIVRGTHGAWQVIAGARRLTAALTVGLETVPAIQVAMDDDEAWQFLLRENMQREDVHPLDEARYFHQCTELGQRLEDIMLVSGKSLSYVHQRLRLLKLLPAVAKHYEAGKISHSVALVVATLTEPVQKQLFQWIKQQIEYDGGTSAGQVRDWISRHATMELSAAPFDTTNAELWSAAGPCHTCPKRTGNTPSLFGALDDKDACTDFKCWEQKTAKHMEAQIAKWKADGVEWTPLAEYHEGKDNYKGRDIQVGYRATTKKDGKVGLIVRGMVPKLGTVVYWTTHQAHHAAQRIQRTPAEVAASRRVKRQQNVKVHFRTLVFEELSKHNPKGAEDLQFIALNVYDGLWHESRKQIAKSLGWELVKQKAYDGIDHYATAKKRLAPMGPAELLRFIHMCALIKTVDRGAGYRDTDHLMARAKELKIKTAPLQKKAEAKFPPVKKPTRKSKRTAVPKKKGKADARSKKQ